jgi:CelD/BcsL family acetyltransferase involved in cellulose biosynthesis/SAM-dependent methyltransferase
MSARLTIEEVRDQTALQKLVPEWQDLWQRSLRATPFQTPAWLFSWWRTFAPGELFTITVRRDGRLVGLAPLYIENREQRRRLLPLGLAVSDYLDFLLDPTMPQSAADAIAAHISNADIAWDLWELSDLSPEADALRMKGPDDCETSTGPYQACPVLFLSDDPLQWQQVVPAPKRRDLRIARNRAGRLGDIAFSVATTDSVSLALDSLIHLHSLRWQTQNEAGVLADPRVQDFHRSAAPALAEAGLLRLYTLTIGGVLAGVYYGFLHRHRAYAYLTGFDPAFAFESPGTLLIAHAIEQATREGAREFDMLRGQEHYKYRWGAEDRWTRYRLSRRDGMDAVGIKQTPPASPPLADPLSACASGELPTNVALMQLAMKAQAPSEVETALADAYGRLASDKDEAAAARLGHALALWRRLPDAFATVKEVLRVVDHAPDSLPPEQAIARYAAAFDQASGLSPPASIALYSLGDASLLQAATDEVVRRMDEWALLHPEHTLLDFGCGNGRFMNSLARRVRFVLGIDVSLQMLVAAQRNCAAFPNAAVARIAGSDLAALADESFHLICAIDVFPYLMQCGADLASRQIFEAVRVLRPGGRLLVINYSYCGVIEADRSDIARLANESGLYVERNGTRDFSLWDGVTFLLQKPCT